MTRNSQTQRSCRTNPATNRLRQPAGQPRRESISADQRHRSRKAPPSQSPADLSKIGQPVQNFLSPAKGQRHGLLLGAVFASRQPVQRLGNPNVGSDSVN